MVRSHLDYCDFIYHAPPLYHQPPLGFSLNCLMEKVEKVQYEAALAITGAWKGSSRSKLYDELGWESLSDRRLCSRVKQIFKIANNLTPDYLAYKLPSHSRPLYDGGIRNSFRELICKSNRYKNSFFPDAIHCWNSIINHFENMPSLVALRKHLNVLFRPYRKSIFGIHDPTGIRYLFQLRVKMSPLRSHKYQHNFEDTPTEMCSCGQGIENTNHFLFTCSFFALERITLIDSVSHLLPQNDLEIKTNECNLYLYGHPRLNQVENKSIIQATICFIKESGRFST